MASSMEHFKKPTKKSKKPGGLSAKKNSSSEPSIPFVADPPEWFPEALEMLEDMEQDTSIEDFMYKIHAWEVMTYEDANWKPFHDFDENPCEKLAIAHLLKGAKGPKADFLRKRRPKTVDEAYELLENSYEPSTKEMLKEVLQKLEKIEVELAEMNCKPEVEKKKGQGKEVPAEKKTTASNGKTKGPPMVELTTHPRGIPIKLRLLNIASTSAITYGCFKELQKLYPKLSIDDSEITTISSILSDSATTSMLGTIDVTFKFEDTVFKHNFHVLPDNANDIYADGWLGGDVISLSTLDFGNEVMTLRVGGKKVSIPWLDYEMSKGAECLMLSHVTKSIKKK